MTAMKVVPVEPTDEMLIAAMKAAGSYAEPFEPATECGIPIEQGMTQEDCDMINAECMECYRREYKAMLSAVEPAPDGLVERSERCADGCLVGEARGAHNACESKCAYADEPPEKTRQVILGCQKLLADWIVPDSGISDHDVLNSLLGILDGPQTREALAAALTSRAAVLEDAAKNDERYRWLRDDADLDNFPSSVHEAIQQGGEQLDIAIDAIRAAKGE